jgi:hypothetical protein
MQTFAQEQHNALSVRDNQDLMMGCAWTTPPEKRLFKMYGEVIHIDCTTDTNIESRPFLTVSGRDSSGSMAGAHVTSNISSHISILSFNSSYVKQRINIEIMLDVSCCN